MPKVKIGAKFLSLEDVYHAMMLEHTTERVVLLQDKQKFEVRIKSEDPDAVDCEAVGLSVAKSPSHVVKIQIFWTD
ncbi:MAG: hypothetical protein WCG01_05300 [bacterium]